MAPSPQLSSRVKKPSWLKVRLPADEKFFSLSHFLEKHHLNTICQSAKCPNVGECWSQKTATFLIMGPVCTRNCGFCAVEKGKPAPLSPDEPEEVAEAVAILGLSYAVVTSVTRDDLPDGGASVFVRTIEAIRKRNPETAIEVLIPDFAGHEGALDLVLEARPDVLNHNLETVESLYPQIHRPEENYRRSLSILARARKKGLITKSGLMVGLGETPEEILQTFADLRSAGCDLLTIGQYLQPTLTSNTVRKYYSPQEFEELKNAAIGMGFKRAVAAPLVRSSYQAQKMFQSLKEEKGSNS